MNKGERLQYACGHWLVAGEFGIQDTYAKDITRKKCGECQRRLSDAAPELLEALERILFRTEDLIATEGHRRDIVDIARAAIALTVVPRDAVQ